MAKHTTYTCDICGKELSEETILSASNTVCIRPGFGIIAARYMKITVEEGDCGMWYTLDICTACRKKIVNYIECMKEKKGEERKRTK